MNPRKENKVIMVTPGGEVWAHRLDVTGLDPWELLAALHNASRVSPTLVCRLQGREDITAAEAEEEATQTTYPEDLPRFPDYLFGRPIKAFLKKANWKGETLVVLDRCDLYDRDVGSGAAARVVESLKR
jgi:hypothetical protein